MRRTWPPWRICRIVRLGSRNFRASPTGTEIRLCHVRRLPRLRPSAGGHALEGQAICEGRHRGVPGGSPDLSDPAPEISVRPMDGSEIPEESSVRELVQDAQVLAQRQCGGANRTFAHCLGWWKAQCGADDTTSYLYASRQPLPQAMKLARTVGYPLLLRAVAIFRRITGPSHGSILPFGAPRHS